MWKSNSKLSKFFKIELYVVLTVNNDNLQDVATRQYLLILKMMIELKVNVIIITVETKLKTTGNI